MAAVQPEPWLLALITPQPPPPPPTTTTTSFSDTSPTYSSTPSLLHLLVIHLVFTE
jgi:hypothetical protein